MACRILDNLGEIAERYDALLCDVWGCYHNGIAPYPPAVAALQAFRARGGTVVLLTNAPRPAPSVQAFLDRMDAPRDSYDGIVSSGAACHAALASRTHGERFLYIGPDRDAHTLTDAGLSPVAEDEAEAVLITGLRDDRTESPEDYTPEIARWRARGLPLLCANPDIVVDRGDQRLWCAGAIAKAYQAAGGEVVWFGKPHPPVYERCFEVLAELRGTCPPKERILAIGDGIGTDVPGAIGMGIAVIFVTGGLADGHFGADPDRPDQAALQAFLEAHEVGPEYAIGRLR